MQHYDLNVHNYHDSLYGKGRRCGKEPIKPGAIQMNLVEVARGIIPTRSKSSRPYHINMSLSSPTRVC